MNDTSEAVLMGLSECVQKYGNQFTMDKLGKAIREDLENWDAVSNEKRNYRMNQMFNVENAREDRYRLVSTESRDETNENNVPKSKLITVENPDKLQTLVDEYIEEEDKKSETDILRSRVDELEDGIDELIEENEEKDEEISRLRDEINSIREKFNAFANSVVEYLDVDADVLFEEMERRLEK